VWAPLRPHVNMLLQYIVPQYMGCHRSGTHCACHRAIPALTISLGFYAYHCLLVPYKYRVPPIPQDHSSQTFSSNILGHFRAFACPFITKGLLLRRRPTPSFLAQCPRYLRRLFQSPIFDSLGDIFLPSSASIFEAIHLHLIT
jgi:hypothetical protein